MKLSLLPFLAACSTPPGMAYEVHVDSSMADSLDAEKAAGAAWGAAAPGLSVHVSREDCSTLPGHPGDERLESVKIEPLIVVTLTRGLGTPDDICRRVTLIYSQDGDLIAERDPFPNGAS